MDDFSVACKQYMRNFTEASLFEYPLTVLLLWTVGKVCLWFPVYGLWKVATFM